MKRRIFLIAFSTGAIGTPFLSFAQQPAKLVRIGFLGAVAAPVYARRVDALRAGLRDLGYVEGKNLAIEFRWAEGNYQQLPKLAAELVASKVDVIVTHGTPGSRAAKQATSTIPVVMAAVGDPVALGIVASLARPGGNITGSTIFSLEMYGKRLELLKEVFPRTRQVAVLVNSDNPVNEVVLPALEAAAGKLGVAIQRFEVRQPGDFDKAFATMAKARVDGLFVPEDAMLSANARAIAEAAIKLRLPSVSARDVVKDGYLMGYGVDNADLYRRAATFVDKILKGAKPGDLPIERATKFELVVNNRTAKAIGFKTPQWLLLRADEVIE